MPEPAVHVQLTVLNEHSAPEYFGRQEHEALAVVPSADTTGEHVPPFLQLLAVHGLVLG